MSLRHPVKVHRPGGAYDAHGRWQEGADPKDITIRASVQPLTAKDLNMLAAEGRQVNGVLRLYTDFKLRVADDGKNSDRVILSDGTACEVTRVEPWQNNIRPHYKALISILSQAPDNSVEA